MVLVPMVRQLVMDMFLYYVGVTRCILFCALMLLETDCVNYVAATNTELATIRHFEVIYA